jgi:hypothetical protein
MELLNRIKGFFQRGSGLLGRAESVRPWWDRDVRPWPHQLGQFPGVQHVVDNRVFLLGLDELYRTAIQKHESTELLGCAQRVAAALAVPPASVPIEGYYTEHPDLTAYFRLMRAFQSVPLERAPEVEGMPEFQRLLAVTSSPIFGPPVRHNLLPVGSDPLSAALKTVEMAEWVVPTLTAVAARIANETDDCSLVGLAARAEDSVVIAALRESVVLYAEMVTGSAMVGPPEYLWQVDPAVAAAAQRFVDAFNGLFGPELPPPTARYAHIFWNAYGESNVIGRCVAIGRSIDVPPHYYHWAVVKGPDRQLTVHEFWDAELWTTARYRDKGLRRRAP